ncbi:MAG: hypothetical protein NT165_04005 [Candidatus Falkowbacteria bacterium]|nr:hypothetical protein [Candidatus Falkowbacteria bacterium]
MAEEEQKAEKISTISWKFTDRNRPERGRRWYIFAGIFLAICLFISFFEIQNWRPVFQGYNSNFLFAVIIILAGIVMFINEHREPGELDFFADGDGLKIGEKFYDYDNIKDFSVLYKPKENLGKLYFEFKNPVQPRISLELGEQNPIAVRNFFLRYLQEDLDRLNEPLSEQLTRVLRL